MEKSVKATYCVQWYCAVLSMNGLLCGSEGETAPVITPIPTLHELVKHVIMHDDQASNLMLQHLEHGSDIACILAHQFHDESQVVVQSMYPITLRNSSCLRTLHTHSPSPCSAIAATDALIVVGDDDGALSVWDADHGQLKAQLNGHTNRIRSLLIDKDGRIISTSNDHTIRVWNTHDFSCVGVLIGHTDWIDCAALSSHKELISGSHDQTARVWDLQTFTMKAVLEGHTNWVTGIAFDADGDIVSVSDDGTVRTWDKTTYASKRVIESPHDCCIRSVMRLPNDEIMIGLINGELHMLDKETYECQQAMAISTDQATQLQLFERGDLLVGTDAAAVRIVDKKTHICKAMIACSCASVLNAESLVTGHDDGMVCFWDLSMLSVTDDVPLLRAALLCKKQERENVRHNSTGLTDEQKLTILQQCVIKNETLINE